jgi:ATP-dependent Zn protease
MPKKYRVYSPRSTEGHLRKVSYHEAGHVLVALCVGARVQKVHIISLATQKRYPNKNRGESWITPLLKEQEDACISTGGCVAEFIDHHRRQGRSLEAIRLNKREVAREFLNHWDYSGDRTYLDYRRETNKKTRARAKKVLHSALERSFNLLKKDWYLVERLAAMLSKKPNKRHSTKDILTVLVGAWFEKFKKEGIGGAGGS